MESRCKNQQDLPHDLITHNILTRLPIKSLVRFKSVSKQWYSTLSSPQFALAHLKLPQPSSIESLIIRTNNKFQFVSYENSEMDLVNLEVDFDVGNYKLILMGSCNGLVCLGSTCGCLFIILNPITRQFRTYWDSEIRDAATKTCTVTWGFGHVFATDDYKIVRICREFLVESIRVHVFSTKFNKWTRIDDVSSHDFSYLGLNGRLHRSGVLVNETLYWMEDSPYLVDKFQGKIHSFDLALELFDTFPHLNLSPPSTRSIRRYDEIFDEFLCVIKGCLSKYSTSRSFEGVVTISKCLGEIELLFVSMDIVNSPCCQNLIGFRGSNDMVFKQYYSGHDCEPRLGIIDLCSRPMRHTSLMSLERRSKVEIISYAASCYYHKAEIWAVTFIDGRWVVLRRETVQVQQRAERDAALARLEQSRIILALRLAEHHGKNYKVIDETINFVGDVRDASCFSGSVEHSTQQRPGSSNLLVKVLLTGFDTAKKTLSLDKMGGLLGNAAVFTVSMLALLHLHQVRFKDNELLGIGMEERRTGKKSTRVDGSSWSDNHLDVRLARG